MNRPSVFWVNGRFRCICRPMEALAIALIFAGCGGGTSTQSMSTSTGTVTVSISDPPSCKNPNGNFDPAELTSTSVLRRCNPFPLAPPQHGN